MTIKFSYTSFSNNDLLEKAKHISEKLTDNTNFQTLVPTLADLNAAITAFEQAKELAVDSSSSNRIARNYRRKELLELLRRLAIYLDLQVNGNRELLATTGFDLRAETRTPTEMAAVKDLVVSSVLNNRLHIKFKKVKAAKSYTLEYRVVGDELWQMKTTPYVSNVLEGLHAGKEYEVRVYGVNKSNSLPIYSTTVRSFVL